MKISPALRNLLYPAGLALLALLVFTYIFDPKIDVNGDNCHYYIFASSLAAGDGYVDMMGKATSVFPPGYPLLMAPLRFITASVVAQKVLNLLFLFGAVLLFYYVMLSQGVKRALAFIACAAIIVTPHLLEFSRMMMSEASCIFFITLSLFAFTRLPAEGGVRWRSPWLYIFIFSAAYTFYIRTQAMVVVAAFAVALLAARRFKELFLFAGGFVVALLPWVVRNALLGLEQSRYVSQLDFSRVWSIVCMLVVQVIPESVLPFFRVQYGEAPPLYLFFVAVVMLALVFYGFWRLKGVRIFLIFALLGNIAIVSVMNSPSYYRYMIIVMPLITIGLLVGLWSVCDALCNGVAKKNFSPWFLLLLFVPAFLHSNDKDKDTVWGLHYTARKPYPHAIGSYIAIGEEAVKCCDTCIVASRKPEFLYVCTGLRGVNVKKAMTNIEILNDLISKKVDMLILENLGSAYTYEVLYPFVNDHPQFFTMLARIPTPPNILFEFHREKARQYLKRYGYLDVEK